MQECGNRNWLIQSCVCSAVSCVVSFGARADVVYTQQTRFVSHTAGGGERLEWSLGGGWSKRLGDVGTGGSISAFQSSNIDSSGITVEATSRATTLAGSFEANVVSQIEVEFTIGPTGMLLSYDIFALTSGTRSIVRLYLERFGVDGGSVLASELPLDAPGQDALWGSAYLSPGRYWLFAQARVETGMSSSEAFAHVSFEMAFNPVPAPPAMTIFGLWPCFVRRRRAALEFSRPS